MSSDAHPEIKSCGFIVFREVPRLSFLLMRHGARWDLPKGHVDPGESELQCALRELDEESGIRRQDIEIIPNFCYRHRYHVVTRVERRQPRLKELVVFLARLQRPVSISLTEHIGFEWFDWDPPHQIQEQTIDPLLAELESFWSRHEKPFY